MHLIPSHFDWRSVPFAKAYHPVIGIVVYLTVIFSLRRAMRDRPPIKLRYLIFLHNVFLCVLSAAMGIGIVVEVVRVLVNPPKSTSTSLLSTSTAGFREVLCDTSGNLMSGRMAWWMYIFYVSKYYEFIDTVIMVLTKRPLNFLHVYHHCIVLPLFYVYMSTSMILQWIIVIANCFVHVAMYYYYAMASMGHKVWWKKYITMAQIVQFIIDLTSTWPYPFLYFSNAGCSGSMRAWLFGQAVGFSFFKLFTDFYTRSYNSKKKAAAAAAASANNNNNNNNPESSTTPLSSSNSAKDDLKKEKESHSKSS